VQWVNNTGNTVTWTNSYDGGATTFDNNAMQFVAPVDMYEGATTNYDKYLLFPKSNIITPLPGVNFNEVFWINSYNDLLSWVNTSGQPVTWITESV
jgi:hypothetical protein